MKRIVSYLMTIILAFICVNMSTYATDNSYELPNEICILSSEVPDTVTNYAKSFFSSLTYPELIASGFSRDEIVNLRIASGLTTYEYDNCDFTAYYFPVIANDEIVAILTLTDSGDDFIVQFGKNPLSDSLNSLYKTNCGTYLLLISEDALFALNENNQFTILESFVTDNLTLPSITYQEASAFFYNTVDINSANTYDTQISLISPYTISEFYINVPFVANGTTSAFPNGYCWASSVASIIKYRTSLPLTAVQIRNQILSDAGNPPSYVGYDYQIKTILQKYLPSQSITLKSGTGRLSFSSLQSIIDSYRPIYTDWQASGSAHAMVVRGYYYNSVVPGNDAYRISLMDPNYSTYQICVLGSEYKIGTKLYTWYSSVY